MGIKKHKAEKIVTKLRQVEVLAGQGMARVKDFGAQNPNKKILAFDNSKIHQSEKICNPLINYSFHILQSTNLNS